MIFSTRKICHDVHHLLKTLDQLKYNKRALLWIIAINAALAVASNIIDWPWLLLLPWQVVIFAPICSLYPVLLLVWFVLWYFKKKIPGWYTTFLTMGLISYGIMAWIYYPAYMSWAGYSPHDAGSILWVSMYAIQVFIIASEIKKIPWYQYIPIFGYFFLKDYSDRYWGTFIGSLIETYPENLRLLIVGSIVSLHIFTAFLVIYLPLRRNKKNNAILRNN